MTNPFPLDLSVVAPCFNEEPGLPEFHRRVTDACRGVAGSNYEIVLVDDGSRDGTWEVISSLAERDLRVKAIRLSRNHGHQLALTAGLFHCSGRRILVIDADLQDPPELLPAMMAQMDDGADVVYGQRRHRAGETHAKRWTAALFYRLLQPLIEIEIPLDTGDFRLLNRRALDVLNAMPERYRFIRGMVSWIGMKQVPIIYDRDARFAGTTKYPLSKMIRFAIDAVTGFSVVPLRTASYLGITFGIFSLFMLTYTLGSWLFGHVVEGWTSVTTILLVVSSAELLVLGILGEYVGRLYMESKRRPLFVVDRIVSAAVDRTVVRAASPSRPDGASDSLSVAHQPSTATR
jgi:polyisoprenyl-phosphate glycosyltransferase